MTMHLSVHAHTHSHTQWVNNELFAPKGVGDVFGDQATEGMVDNGFCVPVCVCVLCFCIYVCVCVRIRGSTASTEAVWRARRDRAVFPGSPQHDGPHQGAAEKVTSLISFLFPSPNCFFFVFFFPRLLCHCVETTSYKSQHTQAIFSFSNPVRSYHNHFPKCLIIPWSLSCTDIRSNEGSRKRLHYKCPFPVIQSFLPVTHCYCSHCWSDRQEPLCSLICCAPWSCNEVQTALQKNPRRCL